MRDQSPVPSHTTAWFPSIDEHWQDNAEPWQRKPVAKLHYKVTLEDGRRMRLFRNMDHGGWYHLTT